MGGGGMRTAAHQRCQSGKHKYGIQHLFQRGVGFACPHGVAGGRSVGLNKVITDTAVGAGSLRDAAVVLMPHTDRTEFVPFCQRVAKARRQPAQRRGGQNFAVDNNRSGRLR